MTYALFCMCLIIKFWRFLFLIPHSPQTKHSLPHYEWMTLLPTSQRKWRSSLKTLLLPALPNQSLPLPKSYANLNLTQLSFQGQWKNQPTPAQGKFLPLCSGLSLWEHHTMKCLLLLFLTLFCPRCRKYLRSSACPIMKPILWSQGPLYYCPLTLNFPSTAAWKDLPGAWSSYSSSCLHCSQHCNLILSLPFHGIYPDRLLAG